MYPQKVIYSYHSFHLIHSKSSENVEIPTTIDFLIMSVQPTTRQCEKKNTRNDV